jgi:hypothetical protein
MSRAFSARSEAVNIRGAFAQAGNEAAPLAQNRSDTIATARAIRAARNPRRPHCCLDTVGFATILKLYGKETASHALPRD